MEQGLISFGPTEWVISVKEDLGQVKTDIKFLDEVADTAYDKISNFLSEQNENSISHVGIGSRGQGRDRKIFVEHEEPHTEQGMRKIEVMKLKQKVLKEKMEELDIVLGIKNKVKRQAVIAAYAAGSFITMLGEK